MKKMSKTPVPVAKIKALKPEQTKEPMPPKGASLKAKPVAKKSEKEIKSTMKNASKAMADAKAKKQAAEDKALRRNKRAAAATVGAMVGSAIYGMSNAKRILREKRK